MQLHRHYSFDLWMTLIKSNPAFKLERAAYFHKKYNAYQKSTEEVTRTFRTVDLMCNAINERTGGNIDAEEMYLMVISLLNDNQYPLVDVDVNALYQDMEALVMKYIPVVYCTATTNVLHTICNSDNCTISLLSNTGFIKGSTLRKVLAALELDGYFSFQLYSDEIGMSKPNPQLFKIMTEKVTECRKMPLQPSEIIHIGDNERADIYGAGNLGISTHLINSNNRCISTLIQ